MRALSPSAAAALGQPELQKKLSGSILRLSAWSRGQFSPNTAATSFAAALCRNYPLAARFAFCAARDSTHARQRPARRVGVNDLVDPILGGRDTSRVLGRRLGETPLMQRRNSKSAFSMRDREHRILNLATLAATCVLEQPGCGLSVHSSM